MLDIIYRYDPERRLETSSPASAQEARRILVAGNRDFAEIADPFRISGEPCTRIVPIDLRDLGITESEGTAPEQRPFAVVLGCSDARVPTELIFRQACNSLFVVRVAGNVLGSECLGSIDYAVQNLGDSIKLLVVLGHSGCGAVTAAVDAFLQPRHYLDLAPSHPVRAIVDRLLLPVRAAARALDVACGPQATTLPGYRRALIECGVALNAALTAATLKQDFRDRLRSDMEVLYGVYNLVSRRVQLPTMNATDVDLEPTSEGMEGLFHLADRLAQCERIQELLAGPKAEGKT
jgi:carbonic anhydrase